MSSDKLPTGWTRIQLEDIIYLKNGAAFKSNSYREEGIPLLRISNINNDTIDFNKIVFVEEDDEYANFIVENNDILIAMSGATTGKIGLNKIQEIAYQNQRVGNIKPYDKDLIKKEFIFYFLKYKKKLIEELAYGGAQPNISSKMIEKINMTLPPLNEQKRIVKKIEKLFANLDNSDKHLAHLEKQLKRYRQSVLKSAFEGELTREWREEQSDLEITNELLEKIKIERIEYIEQEVRKKFKDKTEKWIADKVKKELDKFYNGLKQIEDKEKPYNIPKEWNWVRLDELSKKITDGTHHTPTYVSEGISFISVKDIRNKKINFENCKYISAEEHHELYKRCNPENNDVLITKSGTIGRSCVVQVDRDFSLFVSVALIKPFLNLLNPYYLMYRLDNYIFMTNIQQTIKGGVIKNLHIVDMRQLVFPLLSTKEQNEIVKQIEKHFSIIDKLESVVQKSITESKRLRQSILKQAFEGKLVEQDPNDESAEELLKKIAKAKEEYKKEMSKRKKK